MINQVWKYIQQMNMLEKDDYVVAGVSGGADSVCLLLVLLEIQKKLPFTLHVVHINHGIRQEAGEDADYVELLCRKYDIAFTLVEAKVEEIAQKQKISTEEAGRQVRYQSFYRVLKENAGKQKGKIAIAHNKNDSCETFLFNLFRGSGLKGLSGIQPIRDKIIRPLLCLERMQIEEYLKKNQIYYCVDKTNLEDDYTRNRIRHHILPFACKEISEGAVMHIQDAADKISQAWDFISDMTDVAYADCVKRDKNGYHISKEALYGIHKTLRGYVLYEVLAQAANSRKDLETVHIEQLLLLMENQTGRELYMPYGLKAYREYDGICIARADVQMVNTDFKEFLSCIDLEQKERLENGETLEITLPDGAILAFSIFDNFYKQDCISDEEFEKNIPVKPYTKWFDYDKIKDNIVIRTRQSGDFLTINSVNQRKSLKEFFINKKIPGNERDCIWLVTEKSHVIWVVGNRISSYYKVSRTTEKILQILYRGGTDNVRTCKSHVD